MTLQPVQLAVWQPEPRQRHPSVPVPTGAGAGAGAGRCRCRCRCGAGAEPARRRLGLARPEQAWRGCGVVRLGAGAGVPTVVVALQVPCRRWTGLKVPLRLPSVAEGGAGGRHHGLPAGADRQRDRAVGRDAALSPVALHAGALVNVVRRASPLSASVTPSACSWLRMPCVTVACVGLCSAWCGSASRREGGQRLLLHSRSACGAAVGGAPAFIGGLEGIEQHLRRRGRRCADRPAWYYGLLAHATPGRRWRCWWWSSSPPRWSAPAGPRPRCRRLPARSCPASAVPLMVWPTSAYTHGWR